MFEGDLLRRRRRQWPAGARRLRADGRARARAAEAPPLRVAYHAACSLQHGQQVRAEPKALLKAAGFEVVEPRDSHLCCGSAGTYNLLQPAISAELRARKVATLEERAPQVIAAGNIGCMMQIGSATPVPVVHTAELLDWATGGPRRRRAALVSGGALRSPSFSRPRSGRAAAAASTERRMLAPEAAAPSRRRAAQHRRHALLHRDPDRPRGDRHRGALPLPSADRERVPLTEFRFVAGYRHGRGRGAAPGGAHGDPPRLRLRGLAAPMQASAPTSRSSSSTRRIAEAPPPSRPRLRRGRRAARHRLLRPATGRRRRRSRRPAASWRPSPG